MSNSTTSWKIEKHYGCLFCDRLTLRENIEIGMSKGRVLTELKVCWSCFIKHIDEEFMERLILYKI